VLVVVLERGEKNSIRSSTATLQMHSLHLEILR